MRSPRARGAKVKGPFTFTRDCGPFGEFMLSAYPFCCDDAMLTLFFRCFRRPQAARGVPGRDKRSGGPLHPSPATFHGRPAWGITSYVLLL